MSGSGRTDANTQKYKLEAEEELRIEVSDEKSVTVTLLSGDAEIFGIELAVNKAYNISNRKLPIFSWHGCELSIAGQTDFTYKAKETPMPVFVNVFSVIHHRRLKAKELISKEVEKQSESDPNKAKEANKKKTDENSDSKKDDGSEKAKARDALKGPRVLIMGPPESGKSSLASLLLNYSVKSLGKSLFVDLDITRNMISVPGCIAAATVSKVDIEEGALLDSPLGFFYGYLDPNQNSKELERLISRLGTVLDDKLNQTGDLTGSGYIASVGGWIENCSREFIASFIKNMRADVVLVVGAERMYANVKQVMEGHPEVEIVDVPRSGGVVRNNEGSIHKSRFRQYFYGPSSTLNPFRTVVEFSNVNIFRIGGGTMVPLSALPIGAAPTLDPHRLAPVTIQADLIHSVLAVSQANVESEVANAPVAGFVHVTMVDTQTKMLTLLAPSPGDLPSKILLMGSLKWLE